MRRIVQFFTMLMMVVCYSATAYAVVDPYEVMQVTPAEGNVTSLQHFTITVADLPVRVAENAVPTLEKGGGATVEGTMRVDADGKTVIIDFEEAYTTPGHYFLNIPEESLIVNNQTLLPLSLRFIIPVTPESFYEQITIDPAEGIVESLQNYGAFVNLGNGLSGLVHISQISNTRIAHPSAVLKVGQKVIYSKYAGTEVKLDDEEFIIVKQNDVLAVVE